MRNISDDVSISRHAMGCGCVSCRTDTERTTNDTERTTGNTVIDSIDWGTALPDNTITVYFVPAGERLNTGFGEFYTSEGFNAYEKGQIAKAFARIEAVINVDFQIVTGAAAGADADFKLMLDTDEIPDFLGFFNPPGEEAAGIGVFNGDVWDRRPNGDLEEGGFAFVTVMHEILHGMGLAHPHDDGGGSPNMPGVRFEDDLGNDDLNQGVFTTMTYNSGYLTGTAGSTPPFSDLFGYEAGPMALDIAVLQDKYGAVAAQTGDSTYVLPGNNNAGTMWQAIWDTGGGDLMRYSGTKDARLDLRAATLEEGAGAGGYVSSAKGVAGGWTIAHGVVIEDAQGGAGDDWISGNAVANLLRGGAGQDQIRGRSGADNLRGEAGDDWINGGSGADELHGGRGRDKIVGSVGDDDLFGGGGKDRLLGGGGDDLLRGNRGDDRIKGGDGADELHGGRGADIFRFTSQSHSVAGADTRDDIMDFNTGRDQIDLRRMDADSTVAGNQAFTFVGRNALSDAGDLALVKRGGDWLVRGDFDGDGQADLEIMLRDASRPDAGDFLL